MEQRERDDTSLPVTRTWKLSPSDFAFLWEECRRCFFLKVVRAHQRPRMPFPGIFSKIDSLMKTHFGGKRTTDFSSALPPGTFTHFGGWVESEPFAFAGRSSRVYVRGSYDTVISFDDGSFGVVDFKTASARSETTPLYARQLHAYAWALERPAAGKPPMAPVKHLGLLCFEPDAFGRGADKAHYTGSLTWVPTPRDDVAFEAFLREVAAVLDGPMPAAAPECEWCRYRATVRSAPD